MTRTTRRWRRKREEKIFKCTICDFETESKTSLRKHLRKHTSRRKFKCERCKRKFLNKEKYEHHVADHKTYVYKIYKCTICEKTYKTKQYMREYQKSHMFGPHSPLQMSSMWKFFQSNNVSKRKWSYVLYMKNSLEVKRT